METRIVAVDLAKLVFEVAIADSSWRIVERHRLSRAKFATFFVGQSPCRIVMEACGTAHFWGRQLINSGHEVTLLPAQYVRAYVRRNKTDRADASALIEAYRCADMAPVPVKTVNQQQIQSLHRMRTQWVITRTRYINALRGTLREYGFNIPLGTTMAKSRTALVLGDHGNDVPQALRAPLTQLLAEVHVCDERIAQLERDLRVLAKEDAVVKELLKLPGVGLLTATAVCASVADIQRFPSGRHFASWLGLTARETSSGQKRRMGHISKQGDVYLRTLMVHGARSALTAARVAQQRGKPLDRLRSWALECEQRRGRNRTAVALANRMARIIWAIWKHRRIYDGNWAAQPV
jgi:transposase